MSTSSSTLTEADILDKVVASSKAGFGKEFARAILDLHFDEGAAARLNELAEKNRQGMLAESERAELDKYLRVGNFLNLMQAKARLSLSTHS